MWSAARCDGARWAPSHGRGPGADRPLTVIPDEAVSQVACGGRTMTRIGVGLNPLQGFRVCGQFEMTASVSISARRSTWSPGRDTPSTIAIAPSGWTGTFMNQLMLVTMSFLPSPKGARARRKLLRQLCVSWTPYRSSLLSWLQHPTLDAWLPDGLSTTV